MLIDCTSYAVRRIVSTFRKSFRMRSNSKRLSKSKTIDVTLLQHDHLQVLGFELSKTSVFCKLEQLVLVTVPHCSMKENLASLVLNLNLSVDADWTTTIFEIAYVRSLKPL